MSRSIFGWSYPPGAAGDPNAPWNQEDPPCEVCCKPADACICPECPVCKEHGNPKCYAYDERKGKGVRRKHGMLLNRDQEYSRQEARNRALEERLAEGRMVLDMLKENPEFEMALRHSPDPFA